MGLPLSLLLLLSLQVGDAGGDEMGDGDEMGLPRLVCIAHAAFVHPYRAVIFSPILIFLVA